MNKKQTIIHKIRLGIEKATRSFPIDMCKSIIHKIRLGIEKATTGLAVFLMLSLVILSFTQVILRNLFSIGFDVIEIFMRNGVLWIAFVGAVLTTLRGRHISVDILPRFLKGFSRKVLEWIITVGASIICLFLTWYAMSFVKFEIEFKSTIGGVCPSWIVQIILPIGFFLLAVSFLLRLLDKVERSAAE